MLRVSVVREILNSRISACASETSKPSAMVPPIVVALKNPRRVSSMSALLRGSSPRRASKNNSRTWGGFCQGLYRDAMLWARDPVRVRVDVEPALAEEPHQRQPGGLGKLHGEAGGRRYRSDDRDPRGVCFLNNFE